VTAASPIVIGVAGGSASGKTSVAQAIIDRVGRSSIAHLIHDVYYRDLAHLPIAERALVNFDHPQSLDTPLMVEQIRSLIAGSAIDVPTYDYARYVRLAETTRVLPRPVILVEGILIFSEPELRQLMQIKVFVDTDADLRLIRRIRRDMVERGRSLDSVLIQYEQTVRPMHLEFVEPSRRFADVIVPGGGWNEIAIEVIAARLQAVLRANELPAVHA
jgi:uridine kinase